MGGQIIELRQDIWFKDGFIQGKKEGYEDGYEQRDRDKITEMLRKGKAPEEIADFCDYPMDLIKEVHEELLSLNQK